jgi:FtsZ-interacting cell division protein ZipA
MSYVVTSPHVRTLKSGRMVHPGQEVSDEEAADNPRLVERGDLTLRQDSGEAERKAAEEQAATERKAAADAKAKEKRAKRPRTGDTHPPATGEGTNTPASGSVPAAKEEKK